MNPDDSPSLIRRPDFQLLSSRGFVEWLADIPLSVMLTTYHVGGVIMLGSKPNGTASMHVAAFDRSMGCWTDGQTMWLVTERAIWRLENDLSDGQMDELGYDRVFVPRVGFTTGEVDAHELSVDATGRPVFVNTSLSCLATVDDRYSFQPLWKPSFISQLVPEDRCHLSGLAMADGKPKYVSMHAKSDVADGWRDFRSNGGRVLDVESDETFAEGLSMPHSPRLFDGRLWLLNSGTGYLGWIDPNTRRFEPVTFLAGYARGMAIHGRYAFVGLSKPRREHAFQGLPLQQNLEQRGAAARCGLQVIDLKTGTVVHWIRIESEIEELFDVAVLPGVRQPKALSFTSSTYARQITFRHQEKLQHFVLSADVAPSSPRNRSPAGESSISPLNAQSDSGVHTRENTDNAKTLNNLGLTHAHNGNLDEARDCFEKAVTLDPSHAGAHNNLGNVLREQQQMERAVDCYHAALAADPNYARAYFNLGQALLLLGRSAEATASFSRCLKLDPRNLDAGVALGKALQEQEQWDQAEQCFRQALSLAPESSVAHHGLALFHRQRGDLDLAIQSFDRAIQFEPQSVEALANKALALSESDRFDDALACCDQALSLEPNSVLTLTHKAIVLKSRGRIDEAIACCDHALEIEPECVAAHLNRSMLRLKSGDFARGWPEYEWRWKQITIRSPYTSAPPWDGSPLDGRTILLHAEQGKGDAIQFVRYAGLIQQRGGRVIASADPSAMPLLQMAHGIEQVVSRDNPPPPHDTQAALMSLPACFATTVESIPADVPYFTPPLELLERWRDHSNTIGGFKIGIAWQGNSKFPGDRERSIPLSHFRPLAKLSGVTLISLQLGFGAEQVSEVADEFTVVEPAGPGNESLDFPNTAALMQSLDMVITSDTSIAHLAGALARPVWMALPLACDWRWQTNCDNSPWYPTMRLFRQPVAGDWPSVFANIQRELAAHIANL
ncbi:MAG: TIGR03032 family protein [Pirellulaceae bacterium]